MSTRIRTQLLLVILASAQLFSLTGIGRAATFSARVAASTNDAEETVSNGSMNLNSIDLDLLTSGGLNQTVGMRFTGVTIPQNATINSAYLDFTASASNSGAATQNFFGQAANNAGTFTSTAFNISGRTKTSAQATWGSVPAWTSGQVYTTPNLASLVQEIVNRGGWASGNAMVFIVTGSGTRAAQSFDGSAAQATYLRVDYSVGTDLMVDKVVNDTTPREEQSITYTVTVANNGPLAATGIQVTDLLPAGLSFVSATPSQGSYVSGTGVWTVGSLAISASATLALTATVNDGTSGQVITNTASITAAGQADPNAANNSDSVGITVTCDPPPLPFIDPFTRADNSTVGNCWTETQSGADNSKILAGKLVFDTNNLAYSPIVQHTFAEQSSGVLRWAYQFNWQRTGNETNFAVWMQLGNSALFVNPATSNNTGVAVNLKWASIDEGMTDIMGFGYVQGAGVHQVAIVNGGPSASHLIEVIADLSTHTFTLYIDGVVKASCISFDNAVPINAVRLYTNVVTGANFAIREFDDMTVEVPTNIVNLAVLKSTDNPQPPEGGSFHYTINLSNGGPANATGVQITDLLPAGVTHLANVPSQGTYNPATGLWTVGNVNNGAGASLVITAKPNAGTADQIIANTATLSAVSQRDRTACNDAGTVQITVQRVADLRVDKTVNDDTPNESQSITYTIALVNDGPYAATGVAIRDVLPAGITYQSNAPSQGSYNNGTGIWTVGSLNSGATATLGITAVVNVGTGGTVITNTANVSASNQIDLNSGNNTDSVNITVNAALPPNTPTMSPEPLYTAGTSNPVAWSNESGSGATSYLVQRARNSGFTVDLADSGWTPSLTYSFTGLVDGQIYYYRVKARNSNNIETVYSASVFSTQDASSPQSAVLAGNAYQNTLSFNVAYSATDAASGVAGVALFYKLNNGAYTSFGNFTSSPILFTAPSEGNYGFYTVATDAVGNVEAVPVSPPDASTIVDITAPVGSFAINNGDAYTGSLSVTLNSSVTDAHSLQMRFSNDGVTWPEGWVPYAASHAWTLDAGSDGQRTVYADYQDAAGNSIGIGDLITLDRTAPAGTFAVNNGDAYTASLSVTLSSAVTDATPLMMRFSNDGVTWPQGWVTYAASQAWTLAAGADGSRTVFAEYRDAALNILARTDAITVDRAAPAGTFAVNNGDAYTGSLNVTLSSAITDATPLSMRFSNDGVTWPQGWVVYAASQAWTLASGADGSRTVFAEYRDAVLNVFATTDLITVDTTAPAGTFAVNNGDAYTASLSVTLNSAVTDAAPLSMRFSNDGVTWPQGWVVYAASQAWTLASGADGTRTVFAEYRDAALNTIARNDLITVDLTPPAGTFAVNNGDPYTGSLSVTLNSAVTDGTPLSMRFSNDGVTWPQGWVAYAASQAWTLAAGADGSRTVFAEYRDAALNILARTDAITVDRAAPAGTFAVNNGDAYTGSLNVTLSSAVTDATPLSMRFSNDGVTWPQGWVVYAASQAWTLASGSDGSRTVFAEYRDAVLNVFATTDLITVDTTAPAGAFAVNNGDAYTNNLSVTLSSTITDATPLMMRFSNDGVTWPQGWVVYAASQFWTLAAGADGPRTVFAEYRDAALNTIARNDLINVDLTMPAGGFAVNNGNAYTGSLSVTLNSAVSDASPLEMRYSNDGVTWPQGWVPYAASQAWTLTAGADGSRTVFAEFRDAALNTLVAYDLITVDTTAPAGGFAINGGNFFTNALLVSLDSSVSDATPLEMRFSNDGVTWPQGWVPYAAGHPWMLAEGADGLRTVWAEYRDAAGNNLASTDVILADTHAPTGNLLIANGAAQTGSLFVILNSAVNDAMPMVMRFSNDGVNWPQDWVPYSTAYNWNLAAGPDGVRTVWAEYKDIASNVLAVTDAIILDRTPPAGSFAVNSGNNYTAQLGVSLDSQVTDATAIQMRFSNDGLNWPEGWVPYAPAHSWTLTTGADGLRIVRAEYRDVLLHTLALSDSVFLDTAAPAGSFAINSGDALTNNLSVVLASQVLDGSPLEMRFSNDGLSWPEGWVPYAANHAWNLAAGPDGPRTVSGEYRDPVGHVSAFTDGIAVDLTPPAGGFAINGNDGFTEVLNVTLNSTVTDALPLTMRFSNDGLTWPEGWIPYAATHNWNLEAGAEGARVVRAEYRDQAQNVLALADSILYEFQPPAGTFAIAGGSEFTNTLSVNLNNAVTDASPMTMRFSNDGSNWPEGWLPYSPVHPWVLSGGGDGLRNVWAEFRDSSLRILALTDGISVDTAAPAGSFAINNGDEYSDNALVTLNSTVTDANPLSMRFSNDGLSWPEGWVPYAAEHAWVLGEGDALRTVWAEYRDGAGNTLALMDEIILSDAQAPGSVANIHCEPGHMKVTVSWDDPGDVDLQSLEIWRAAWHDLAGNSTYPEYDDAGGNAIPLRPANHAQIIANSEWSLAGTVGPGVESFVDQVAPRGVYYYEVFARDFSNNWSSPASQNQRALNYWLGDVRDSGSGDGSYDGYVNAFDLTAMGAAFATQDGDPGYDNEIDVGPTDDNSNIGIPTTDNVVDFEDLMIFAINYGTVEPRAEPMGIPYAHLAWEREADGITWKLSLMEPCLDLQGLRLRAQIPAGIAPGLQLGEFLAAQGAPCFLRNIDRNGLDVNLALMGTDTPMQGAGVLFQVTLPEGVVPTRLDLELRSTDNSPLELVMDQTDSSEPPASYRLSQNHPNPFNPTTTLGFELAADQNVRLDVIASDGRHIKTLVNDRLNAGHHSVIWEGKDEQGIPVASGLYFYRIDAGTWSETRKMLLMK